MLFEYFCINRKKIAILILTALFGVTGCKPTIEHITVTYDSMDVETYYFDSNNVETNMIEIKSEDRITIEILTLDKRPEHIKNHRFSWRLQGEDVDEWIINDTEERDEGFWSHFEGNKITLKGPQDKNSEITFEITITCDETPELPTSLQFTVKSISQLSLNELNQQIFATAESIKKYIFLEEQAVKAKNKNHVHQRRLLSAITNDHFGKEEANIEDAQKKLDDAKKFLATLQEDNELISKLSSSIMPFIDVEDCLEALSENYGFFANENNSLYRQKLCLNNISDLSHRKGRRRLNSVDNSTAIEIQETLTGLALTKCWDLEFALAMLPEASSKVGALEVLPVCFAIGAIAPALYYQKSSNEQDQYPYIFKQEYFTKIFYSPVLSYTLFDNAGHKYDLRLLKDLQEGNCGNKKIPCVLELSASDKSKLDDLKQVLDRYAISDSSFVLKHEVLTYTQPKTSAIRKLHDNEYRVSLSSDLLKLENNEFDTILWSEEIPDNYYLSTPRYFSGDYIIRVPVASDQKDIFKYLKNRLSKHSKIGDSSSEIIKAKEGFIQCGGATVNSSNSCAYHLSFGMRSQQLSPSSLVSSESQILSHSNAQVVVSASSLIDSKPGERYCRSTSLMVLKNSEAEMIQAQGENMRVGCFSVVVENTSSFMLPEMLNVKRYYIDCDANDLSLDVVPGRECINIHGKTKITVFLVFNENNFRTSYSKLFSGNKSITEFEDLPPYGSQGSLDNGYRVTSYFEMFKASSIQCVMMSIEHALNGISMEGMFSETSSFRGDGNIPFWNTENIVNMSRMFKSSMLFNANLNHWIVANVENMSAMFKHAVEFNQSLDEWNVSNVRNMSKMFSNAAMFNGYIHYWKVGNVENMYGMFSDAIRFNSDISNWKVGKVVNMSYMFKNASVFNRPLKKWKVGNVKYMWEMFNGATFYSQDLSAWKVSRQLDLNDIYKAKMFQRSNLENRPSFQPSNQPQPAQSSNLN